MKIWLGSAGRGPVRHGMVRRGKDANGMEL
jgi:hypothetical protein